MNLCVCTKQNGISLFFERWYTIHSLPYGLKRTYKPLLWRNTKGSGHGVFQNNSIAVHWKGLGNPKATATNQVVVGLKFELIASWISCWNWTLMNPFLFNPLNPELNSICCLLALLAHHFLHVSRIRVNPLHTPAPYCIHILSVLINTHLCESVEITNKMQPCNIIYYYKIYWRLNMFRAAYRSLSGAPNCICSLWFIHTCGDRSLSRLGGNCTFEPTHKPCQHPETCPLWQYVTVLCKFEVLSATAE